MYTDMCVDTCIGARMDMCACTQSTKYTNWRGGNGGGARSGRCPGKSYINYWTIRSGVPAFLHPRSHPALTKPGAQPAVTRPVIQPFTQPVTQPVTKLPH